MAGLTAVVAVLLTFLSLHVDALGGNGVVRPHDPYVYIGNNLTLTCNLTRFDTTYDSRYLVITRHADKLVPSKYITVTSTRSIVLRLPITSPEDAGNYVCKIMRGTTRPILIGFQAVTVEYEPQNVTDISCRVYNWENMTCTWDLGVNFLHPKAIKIQLVWTITGHQYNCPHQTRTSCTWLGVDNENTFVSDTAYLMGVTINNTMTKPNPTYYPPITKRIETAKLVEPAPVTNLSVHSNSTCITVSWSHPMFRRDKVYRVDFKPRDSGQWQSKHVDDDETLTLCGLHPYTFYLFNVTCKPRLFKGQVEGFWSQPATLQVRTEEDVPSESPQMTAGSYMEIPCQKLCRNLHLYWEPVNPDSTNGNITYYRIDYLNMDVGNMDWNSVSTIGKQNVLMLVATDTYMIQLRAATSTGVSKVFSQIIVPAKSKKPAVPEHVVEADNATENTRVTISWIEPSVPAVHPWYNLTSYTVYWCKGYKVGWTCQEPILSLDLPITQHEISLDVNQVERYMFGVAINALLRSGETISSGFTWNTCSFIRSARPDAAVQNVRLSSYQPNSGLELQWDRLTCKETHAYIHNYLVHICAVGNGENCTDSVQVYQASSTQSQFVVTDLSPGTRYKAWVIAAAHGGVGPASQYVYHQVLNRSLRTEQVAGIVIGCLFVIIIALCGIILFCRRLFRRVKQKYFMPVPIEIPHTLPPLPPIPMPRSQTTPDSEMSDGIYEKIDGPPSPCSSTESTTGVEAPLIHQKWKLSTLKSQLYGKTSGNRSGNDSGRESLSHSADTLLMRLHPSHLKKHKKSGKKSYKSESDSGIIVDGRGQVCSYSSGQPSRNGVLPQHKGKDNKNVECCDDHGCDDKGCGSDASANPYSCVDIIDKINSNSERLMRKCSESHLYNACDCRDKYKGSTISLPPGLGKLPSLMSPLIDNRAKSTGNQLDMEERRLSSMKETKELESSELYSEGSTLDSVGDREHETSISEGSQESNPTAAEGCQGPHFSPRHQSGFSEDRSSSGVHSGSSHPQNIDSYSLVDNEASPNLVNGHIEDNYDFDISSCDCSCHSNQGVLQMPVANDAYVTEDVMNRHSEDKCHCIVSRRGEKEKQKAIIKKELKYDFSKNGLRPDSQVFNLPPHFFGSMSSVPMDPSRTTEL